MKMTKLRGYPKNCSKFRQKNLNIVITILVGLRDSLYPSFIARQLDLRRNIVHYYVKKLEKLGFIEKQESITKHRFKPEVLFHFID